MNTLTGAQWEIIRRCDEHMLVAAGAGTGKTFTVVRKLLHLMGVATNGEVVAQPLRLRDIAAITYTNQAGAELKAKLRQALRDAGRRAEAYEVDSARVGTIHAFCGDVLREFALRSWRAPSLAMLDDAQGSRVAYECVRSSMLASIEEGGIPGLESLLAERSVSDVEGWVRALVDQGDHLVRLVARAADMGERERVLLTLADRARRTIEQTLVDRGEMDFDRMITWTRDLLRDDPVVRKALQRRIKVLVIDEFQDVDPVQKEIAWLLGEPTSGRTDTTRLVLVGDPKQSIYRFRKADVSVWREVEDELRRTGAGAVLPLAESFRSVPEVLGMVDHFVGPLLDTPADGASHQPFEVPYASVRPTRRDRPAHAGVELLCVAAKDDDKPCSADVVRRTEARAVARRARELHDAAGVRWGDMALLLNSWKAMDIYTDALLAEGIPTYALLGEGFWERREVLDLIVALEATRSPDEKRWLFGFLRSPLVGLADESLLSLVRQREDVWFRRAGLVLDDAEQQARWARGVALLERWRTLCDRVSVAELLETIIADTGFCGHLRLLHGDASSRQPIGNVRKLVRLASAASEHTVGDFLAHVAEQRDLAVREGDARLFGEGDDVVTVSSVHSAKGLEWGVVFWCDLVRGSQGEHDKLQIGREAIVLGEADIKSSEQSDVWRAVFDANDRERAAESLRLWYVAATRAKDLLVLSGVPLGNGKTPAVAGALKARYADLGATDSIEFSSADGESVAARVRVLPPIALDGEDAGVATLPPLEEASVLAGRHAALPSSGGRWRHSATQLMAQERCGRRYWYKHVLGLKEPRPVFVRDRSGADDGDVLSAIERGLVIHDVMERWEAEAELDALIEDAIERQTDDAPEPASARDARLRESVRGEIESLVAIPELRALLEHPHGRRELPFLMTEPDGSAFEGAIDLVAPGEAGYRLADLKTSQCSADDAAAKAEEYAVQRELYSRAVEQLTGAAADRFAFVFSAPSAVVEHARAEHARALPIFAGPELARSAEECRWCGYRSAGWCAGVVSAATESSAIAT